MRLFLALGIGFAAVVRLAWFAEFAFLSVRRSHPPDHDAWKRLKADALLPPSLRGSREQQEKRYDLFKTHQVAAYTLGGLALATWSILASRPSVDRFALAMLAVTVLISVGVATLFRAAGGELTRMGYESGLSIAGLTLVAAMISLALQTFQSALLTRLAVFALVPLLLVRDVFDARQQMRLTRDAFRATEPHKMM
jgi:hypothetical protein